MKTGRHVSLSVLVIDDEAALCALLTKTIEKSGHSVDTALSVDKCTALLMKKRYDIAFLDILMPDVDCASMLKAFYRLSPQTAIVLMSDKYLNEYVMKDLLARGICAFVQKPFTVGIIKHIIETSCRGKGRDRG
ncbi:MAG: hypothetical protein A2293_05765 [Elusimicrobia bacterium RIFOXYB2_FULL_49_7]|nr:MAG: hypothetical protein A2293_05765 [Elusimicrobia bacterium RIFOXYB2_FULL_49_7]